MPGKAPNEDIQMEFINWYKSAIKKARKGENHILFYDPVHQLHNTINGKC